MHKPAYGQSQEWVSKWAKDQKDTFMCNLPFVLRVTWVNQNIVTCLQTLQSLDTLIIRVTACVKQKNP